MSKLHAKRILLILVTVGCLLLLSGCSFSDIMSWGTGIKQDPDYQTWEKLSENGKLDQDGRYTADAVHVTFAESSAFEMKYYKDPDLKEELSAEGCYLLPGDLIYCTAKVKGNAANYYLFDHLNVIEYSLDNTRGAKLDWRYQNEGTALLIPFDYKGTEVSIEPVGRYKTVSVSLEQPEMGGTVKYTVNGQELTGDTAELYCGAKIKGSLEPDTGWDAQLNQNPVYTVTEAENQVVTFEGKRAKEFFAEADKHMPVLKLEMNRNLKSCRMTIEAAGFSIKDITSGDGGTKIDNQKIGTGKGILVSFNRFDLEDGKNAVRITVTKKTDNTEYKEIHYAAEGNNSLQIDFEYNVTYTSITLNVEAVNAMIFPTITDDNVEITAKFCDTEWDNKGKDLPLAAGDLGTGDRRITVDIVPHEGYKLIGSYTENGQYHREMRLDEFDRFVKETLQNQLKKICTINLDIKDAYGEVSYRIDGKDVAGLVVIDEGQSFVISFTLKDEYDGKYEIAEDRNIFDQINFTDPERFKKYEKVITVTRDMDGKTINRESCITIREKVD